MDEFNDYEKTLVNDPRTIEELLVAALPGGDDSARWDAINALRHRATREVFDAAVKLCADESPYARRTGAAILGQLGYSQSGKNDNIFIEERVDVLLGLLKDPVPSVVEDAAIALSCKEFPRVIEALCGLAANENAGIRFGVVRGLMASCDPRAIAAMIQLSQDTEVETRNWATFVLGSQIDADTPEIRAALWKRVTDEDMETRSEAFVGLAVRGDRSIVDALIMELNRPFVGDYVVKAAGMLGDKRLIPVLTQLAFICTDDRDILDALHRCRDAK